MKKTLIILLAAMLAFTVVCFTACEAKETVVRVKLYITEDGAPIERNHTIGKDDLPVVTNGDLVFDGWYYDKTYNLPFDPVKDTDIVSGTSLYAKWNPSSGTTDEKVTLILNYNYTNSQLKTEKLNKGDTYNLPAPTYDGHTFNGWFTQAEGGTQWTSDTPVTVDTVLYAHWTENGSTTPEPDPTPIDLSNVFNKYSDLNDWNFAVALTIVDGSNVNNEYFEYLGCDVLNTYMYKGIEYTEYLAYDDSGTAYWYYDNGDGTYDKYSENSNEYAEYFYMNLIYLDKLVNYSFGEADGCYVAISPNEAGNAVIAEYTDGSQWTSLSVYIQNEIITKIVGVMSDGYTLTFEFSKYGQVNFSLPEVGGGSDNPTPEPGDVMEDQVYNEATFDGDTLQDKFVKNDELIGLPSTGTYSALVIPVQFQGDTITSEQLNKLNLAFNGTSADTGWESVSSFYKKSSYGNLNLTFDVMDVYNANGTATSYKNKKETVTTDGEPWEKDGSAFLLEEVLSYYANKIDLSKYDYNNDGCLDAVYLIYSEEVDYVNADFYWAYVTWYYGEEQFGGKDAYYYLFAGLDFMTEKVGKVNGLKIDAETYIHETGHLLGLDDYYDYEESKGGNMGLGGADMMDHNVGDHGVYSKIMLGWLNPTIVTSTQTVTIKSSQSGGYAILIPLNFNNSYFCEYLLIDLYTNDGLNAMGASQPNTILYGGASYGVRIYHVSSSINNPYSDEYYSFTDNNNSVSTIPLIKLIEADGETSKSTEGDWAAKSDLWQANDTFSGVFANYTRNDGKTLNFDITVDSVSAESATVTITYNTAA